jgi:hypothetical protein
MSPDAAQRQPLDRPSVAVPSTHASVSQNA